MASIPQETVTVEAQDGHEINDTSWDDRNGLFTHYAGTVGTDHDAGYLFTTVPVPQGATINSAAVTIYVFTTHGAPETLLRGNIGDATDYSVASWPHVYRLAGYHCYQHRTGNCRRW